MTHNKSLRIFVFVFIALVLASPIYAGQYQSFIHSSFKAPNLAYSSNQYVDANTGAAVYSYGFEVPPGTNGLQPTLGVSYNSFARNSYPELVGSGWSFTENYIYTDVQYTPTNTADDKYYLVMDGAAEELVFNGSTYHTKTESYMQLKKISAPANNTRNEYWELKTKDGTTYRFGYNLDSELPCNTYNYYTSRWYLDTVTDMHGNQIRYSYRSTITSGDEGVRYLDTIIYANNNIRIQFNYTQNNYPRTIYSQGQRVTRIGLLSTIETYANDILAKKYSIKYTDYYMSDWAHRYIKSIQEYGSDGISTLSPTTFSYYDVVAGWRKDSSEEALFPHIDFAYKGTDEGVRVLDYNRDGLLDLLYNSEANRHHGNVLFIQQRNGSFTLSPIVAPEEAMFITHAHADLDFDFDGGVRVGDYNGDGYPDLLKGFEDGTMSSTGSHEKYYDIWENNKGTGWIKSSSTFPTIITSVDKTGPDIYEVENFGVEIIDLNGDGYDDIVQSKEGGTSKAWINNKAGGWTRDYAWTLPSGVYIVDDNDDDTGVRFVDLNGDGLIDIYRVGDDYINYAWYNTGAGWIQTTDYNNLAKRFIDIGEDDEGIRFADLNGDGLVDVMEANGDVRRSTFINGGKYWYTGQSSWSLPSVAQFTNVYGDNKGTVVMDINSDGTPDIVRANGESGGFTSNIWVNVNEKPYLLKNVHESMGGNIYYDYTNAKNVTNNNFGFTSWIVNSVNIEPGTVASDLIDYVNCVPSGCPSGYQDYGVTCSGETCTRKCEIVSCGNYATVQDNPKPWSNFDINDDIVSRGIMAYSSFATGKCYRVTTTSGNSIVDSSDIDYEDETVTDSVLILYWTMSGLTNQPWGGQCDSDSVGDMIDHQDHYLIDDSDSGDDFDSADYLGGEWIGYCVPKELGCAGFPSPCITDCYGRNWELRLAMSPMMSDDYEKLDPDDTYGACNAQDVYMDSDAEIDYIDFASDRYVNMKVEQGSIITTTTSNQACSRVKVSSTKYSYDSPTYDYSAKEFRGFAKVTQVNPDSTKVITNYHQTPQFKGLPYSIINYDTTGKTLNQDNKNYSYSQIGQYYVVKLDNEKQSVFDGDSTPVDFRTTYSYDSYGNVISKSYSGDLSVSGDERIEETEYVYNPTAWIVDRVKHNLLKDASGSIVLETKYSYDDQVYSVAPIRGDLTKIEYVNYNGISPVEEIKYDSYGNVITVIDPKGNEYNYEYDSSKVYKTKETNPLNHVTSYDYDAGTGNLLSTTDPNGFVTSYVYDSFGRLTKEVLPYDSEARPTRRIKYYTNGTIPWSIVEENKQSDTSYTQKITYYDGFNNKIQEIEKDPDAYTSKEYYYDSKGRVIKETYPYTKADDSFILTNPDGYVYRYDDSDRIIKVTNIDGSTRTMSYNKLVETDIDEEGNQKTITKDAYGNILSLEELSGTDKVSTTYKYDALNNVLEITDNDGNKVAYNYDTLGRKVTLVDPNLGTWTYEYDVSDNLVAQRDGNNKKIVLRYDALNRIINKESGTNYVEYKYDGQLKGTLDNMYDTNTNITYTYDDRYRVITKKTIIDGKEYVERFTYDSADNILSKKLPNLKIINYEYNIAGLTSKMTGTVSEVFYNVFKQPVTIVFENNEVQQKVFDVRGRLWRAQSKYQDITYKYDKVSNILEITDNKNVAKYTFTYDKLHRLTTAAASGTKNWLFSYKYSKIGNLLNITSNNYSLAFTFTSKPVHAPTTFTFIGTLPFTPNPCVNFVCGDYCNNNTETLYTNGICIVQNNTPTCQYTPVLDPIQCKKPPSCVGVTCQTYCNETTYTYYSNGKCEILNNTPTCTYTTTQNSSQCQKPVTCDGFVCQSYCNSTTYYTEGICYIENNKQLCNYVKVADSPECSAPPSCQDVTCPSYCNETTHYNNGKCEIINNKATCTYTKILNSPQCTQTTTDCNLTCDNYCDGKTYYTNGKCVLTNNIGSCYYDTKIINSPNCAVCLKDSDCPGKDSELSCNSKDVMEIIYSPKCALSYEQNKCELISSTQKIKTCASNEYCSGGYCIEKIDACKNVICNPYCDGLTYYDKGVCVNGNCRYDSKTEMSDNCGFERPFKILSYTPSQSNIEYNRLSWDTYELSASVQVHFWAQSKFKYSWLINDVKVYEETPSIFVDPQTMTSPPVMIKYSLQRNALTVNPCEVTLLLENTLTKQREEITWTMKDIGVPNHGLEIQSVKLSNANVEVDERFSATVEVKNPGTQKNSGTLKVAAISSSITSALYVFSKPISVDPSDTQYYVIPIAIPIAGKHQIIVHILSDTGTIISGGILLDINVVDPTPSIKTDPIVTDTPRSAENTTRDTTIIKPPRVNITDRDTTSTRTRVPSTTIPQYTPVYNNDNIPTNDEPTRYDDTIPRVTKPTLVKYQEYAIV